MLISTCKFFKDNKIARACRANVICSFLKNLQVLTTREIMLLLVNNVHEKKNHRESRET